MPGQKDPVIAKVEALNAGYQNTDYAKRGPDQIGGANIYRVSFKGADGVWRENYVYERGNKRIAYYNIRELLMSRDNDLFPSEANLDLIRLWAVIVFTTIFGIAVIYFVKTSPENKSIQFLTGFVGLGIGYLVGNKPFSGKKAQLDRE